MITGYTSNKLDLIKTFNRANPYVVGVVSSNPYIAVTQIKYDPFILSAITSIAYTIGNINYVTDYTPPNYITRFSTNASGYDFEPYTTGTTIISGFTVVKQHTFDIKEEAKMGQVFPPKISNELFIERMSLAVFEKHSRLAEIRSLEGLIEYRNGYYNIK